MIDRATFTTVATALGGDVKPDEYGTPVLRFQRDGHEIRVRPTGLRDAPETVLHVSTPATPPRTVTLVPSSPKSHRLRALVDRSNLSGDPMFDDHVELRYGFDSAKAIRTLLRDAKARQAIIELHTLGYGIVSFDRDAIKAVWNERPVEEALNAELITRTAELLCTIANGLPDAHELPRRRRFREENWTYGALIAFTVVPVIPFNLSWRIWLWPFLVGLVTAALVGTFLGLRARARSQGSGWASYFTIAAPTITIAAVVILLLTGVSWIVAR